MKFGFVLLYCFILFIYDNIVKSSSFFEDLCHYYIYYIYNFCISQTIDNTLNYYDLEKLSYLHSISVTNYLTYYLQNRHSIQLCNCIVVQDEGCIDAIWLLNIYKNNISINLKDALQTEYSCNCYLSQSCNCMIGENDSCIKVNCIQEIYEFCNDSFINSKDELLKDYSCNCHMCQPGNCMVEVNNSCIETICIQGRYNIDYDTCINAKYKDCLNINLYLTNICITFIYKYNIWSYFSYQYNAKICFKLQHNQTLQYYTLEYLILSMYWRVVRLIINTFSLIRVYSILCNILYLAGSILGGLGYFAIWIYKDHG